MERMSQNLTVNVWEKYHLTYMDNIIMTVFPIDMYLCHKRKNIQ